MTYPRSSVNVTNFLHGAHLRKGRPALPLRLLLRVMKVVRAVPLAPHREQVEIGSPSSIDMLIGCLA